MKENIIHKFGLSESIIIDQGTMFTGKEMKEFAKEYRFKLICSTLYYA